ncbi:MAG: flagellar filament capping protein FliD [Aminipila sp.]
MTSINTVASSNTKTSAYVAKGFSGLVSGMETEEIVEAMTSDIQAKIDKVKQQQQKNTWKQDAYRTVISSLTSFEDKFLSYTSPSTNLLSSKLYNCSRKVPQGANASKISVTSTSSSEDAAYQITSVKALATKATYTGNCGIGGDTISSGAINFGARTVNVAAGKSLEIIYDNVRYNLTLPEADVAAGFESTSMSTQLEEALRQVYIEGSSTTTLADKLSFSVNGDKLSLKADYSGDTSSFSISGGDAATLSALGLPKDQIGSASSPIQGTTDVHVLQTVPFSLDGKKLTLNLDGISKTISFNAAESADIMAQTTDADRRNKMAQIINTKLEDSFGAGKITAAVNGDKLDFKVNDSTSILKITSSTTDTTGTNGIFGIEDGITNRLDKTKTVAQLGFTPTVTDAGGDPNKNVYKLTVNGKDFEFKGSDEITTVLNKINNDEEAGVTITYLSSTNKFAITADEAGATGNITIADSAGGNLAAKLFGTATAVTKSGTDLEMTIKYNGDAGETTITRSSNSVTLDGISFNVEGTFGWTAGARDITAEGISFKSEADTDDTIKVIKDMAEAYNKIIDSVNELVSTKSRKSNKRGQAVYEPLTDAQKQKMTSQEIEAWEKKAKEGILFGDSTLTQLASSLRFAFSSKIGDLGYANDIGISTASSYSGNGKLTIDEDKLKQALTNDPEKVKAMFTASEQEAPNTAHATLSGGLATRVKGLFESYAKSTGAYKGKIVQLAGLQNNATTDNNYIDRQQKILSNKLESLQDLLKQRQDRYQSQFTKLEQYMSKMNSQSSWLSSATS